MLRDLNDLLAAHARGEDAPEQLRRLHGQAGKFFPESPQAIEELVDAPRCSVGLPRSGCSTSMSREWRWAAGALAAGVRLPRLMEQLARTRATSSAAVGRGLVRLRADSAASEGLGLGDGTGVLQDIAELDELSERPPVHAGSRLDDIDLDALSRQAR